MATLITLLTDFGIADSYVGEVKGVLLSQVHGAALVDITHQVPPGDVRAAQYILSSVWHRFPQGSVHLAVVDPGVGTDRGTLLRRPGQRPAVVSAGARALRGPADPRGRRADFPSARRVRAGGGP